MEWCSGKVWSIASLGVRCVALAKKALKEVVRERMFHWCFDLETTDGERMQVP